MVHRCPLHTKYAEARGFWRHAIGKSQTETKHVPRLPRLNDAVIPETRRGVVWIALRFILVPHALPERLQLFFGYGVALEATAANVNQNGFRRFGAHCGNLRIRPGEHKARSE